MMLGKVDSVGKSAFPALLTFVFYITRLALMALYFESLIAVYFHGPYRSVARQFVAPVIITLIFDKVRSDENRGKKISGKNLS